VNQTSLDTLFRSSTTPDYEAWEQKALRDYTDGPFVYLKEYRGTLCDGTPKVFTIAFKDATGASQTARWEIAAWPNSSGACGVTSRSASSWSVRSCTNPSTITEINSTIR